MSELTVNVHNEKAAHPIILVCEHASAFIPPQYNQLGLSSEASISHIAWDPGASAVAHHLANAFNAVLIESAISRLVYDCNRPPDAISAIPTRSEIYDIPGNVDLSIAERENRINTYYRPFESMLTNAIAQHPGQAVILTIHSFTPVFNGQKRDVEIGVLHDTDSRLANAIVANANGFNIQLNQPYAPEDGVTHTLKVHGIQNKLLNVMLEIRNDLISEAALQKKVASKIQQWLIQALHQLNHPDIDKYTR